MEIQAYQEKEEEGRNSARKESSKNIMLSTIKIISKIELKKELKKEKKEKKEKKKKREGKRSDIVITNTIEDDDGTGGLNRNNNEDFERDEGFLEKALFATKDTRETKSNKQIEREREEQRSREVCASRELAGKNPSHTQEQTQIGNNDTAVAGVGDGGASWRLKALRRAKERAQKEGRNLEEEVANRFGSVEALVSGLGGANRAAHDRSHLHAKHERKGNSYSNNNNARKSNDAKQIDDELIKSSLEEAKANTQRINAFASDGSFMESFAHQQQHKKVFASKQQQQQQQQQQNNDNNPSSKNLSAAQMIRMRLAAGKSTTQEVTNQGNINLPLVTEDGKAMPGAFGKRSNTDASFQQGGSIEKRAKQTQMFDDSRNGEKLRYYKNDDTSSLRDLVAREKHGGGEYEDYDANAADNIARKKKYKVSDMNVDDEYDHDAGIEMYENRRTKMSLAKQQQKAKQDAVQDFTRMQSVHSKCAYCENSASMPRNMQIAHGYHTYLMLPPVGRLVPGHCIIAPKVHARSSRQVDEDVWEEIRNFKKCLVKTFIAQGKECCFIETAMKLGAPTNSHHAMVECIPLPFDVAGRARMYFKKAIDEAESEWSTHNSKKCISTAPPQSLLTTIPPNFPYFHVEFNMSGGFVHVIDDESKWQRRFGRDVLIGLLDLPENLTQAKERALAPALFSKEKEEFVKAFALNDWTQAL